MDLKGSLIDSNLKIYPSKKLLQYLESLPTKDVPVNIAKIVAGQIPEPDNLKENTKSINIDLNNADIEILNKIKEYVVAKDPKEIHNENDCNQQKDSEKGESAKSKIIKNTDDLSNKLEKDAFKEINKKFLESNNDEESEKTEKEETQESEAINVYLTTQDIDWLYSYLQKERKKASDGDRRLPFLHELLEDADILMPSNEIIKRNPQLEARCVKLRAQQEAREYRKMTKTVDNVRISYPEDTISYQMKQLNRQLIAIGQFLLSIFAGFMFGFKGVQWMAGTIDFGVRMLMGVMCALIIALAEIYFLAKKLNEELSASQTQTIQIGGPPKLASDQNYFSYLNVPEPKKTKTHQD